MRWCWSAIRLRSYDLVAAVMSLPRQPCELFFCLFSFKKDIHECFCRLPRDFARKYFMSGHSHTPVVSSSLYPYLFCCLLPYAAGLASKRCQVSQNNGLSDQSPDGGQAELLPSAPLPCIPVCDMLCGQPTPTSTIVL